MFGNKIVKVVLVALTLSLNISVWACATCGGGDGALNQKIIKMTALFSFLPLSLIAFVAYWVWKQSRRKQ